MKNQQFIGKAVRKEFFELREMENFISYDEAKSFIRLVYENAMQIVDDNPDSYFVRKMLREVEVAYYSAMNADSGFMVHTYAELALGWFVKMVNTYC